MDIEKIMENIDKGIASGLAKARAKSGLNDGIETLRASLAAIHYHSGRYYHKTAHNGDEAELIAILRTIRDECETVIPELRGL